MKPKVDMRARVGAVSLPNPVMTASGTSGHGDELGRYVDLGTLGAVVVKSLSVEPWAGNPAPRVHETDGGMINSVGLQNPGVEAWLERELPPLLAAGARVVGSIWGFRAEDYAKAASLMSGGPDGIVAIEANLSCPNVEARRNVFAHSASATRDAIGAAVESAGGRPVWAKLSPNVTDITEIAAAALEAGAAALTLVNTVMGMAIDPATATPRLGAGGGGLSGPAIRPVAVRAIFDCRVAFPGAAIVGVGGVARGEDAAELLAAGADAVQVGTATFLDPRAPARVLEELTRWCRRHDIRRIVDLKGSVHGQSGG